MKKIAILIVVFLGISLTAQSQVIRRVCGTITNAEGEPEVNAYIKVVGESIGTVSDYEGNYCLEVPVGSILEISSMGKETRRLIVGTRKVEEYTGVGNKSTTVKL